MSLDKVTASNVDTSDLPSTDDAANAVKAAAEAKHEVEQTQKKGKGRSRGQAPVDAIEVSSAVESVQPSQEPVKPVVVQPVEVENKKPARPRFLMSMGGLGQDDGLHMGLPVPKAQQPEQERQSVLTEPPKKAGPVLTYSQERERFELGGDTFAIRDTVKAAKWRWDGDNRINHTTDVAKAAAFAEYADTTAQAKISEILAEQANPATRYTNVLKKAGVEVEGALKDVSEEYALPGKTYGGEIAQASGEVAPVLVNSNEGKVKVMLDDSIQDPKVIAGAMRATMALSQNDAINVGGSVPVEGVQAAMVEAVANNRSICGMGLENDLAAHDYSLDALMDAVRQGVETKFGGADKVPDWFESRMDNQRQIAQRSLDVPERVSDVLNAGMVAHEALNALYDRTGEQTFKQAADAVGKSMMGAWKAHQLGDETGFGGKAISTMMALSDNKLTATLGKAIEHSNTEVVTAALKAVNAVNEAKDAMISARPPMQVQAGQAQAVSQSCGGVSR